ncbi:MAG: Cif family virulence factor [Acidiferrobacter sp.]
MTQSIPEEMLTALAHTANALDYSAHMALISRSVNVFGVTGFEVIGYDDWARQCQHEFAHKLLKGVSYEGLQIVSTTASHILFKTVETAEGTDGTVNHHGLEILIHKEPDGVWRVTQERILPPEEVAFDRRKSR